MIEEIIRRLEDHFQKSLSAPHFVVTAAFWDSIDHATVDFLQPKGGTSFFVKMARLPCVSRRVREEANCLKRLNELHVKNVPELVLDGDSDGRAFLVERFIGGERLKDSTLSRAEKLRLRLDWLKLFYNQTMASSISPDELMHRAEAASKLARPFVDLTDAMSVLESCLPVTSVPAVCRHGDAYDINFLLHQDSVTAVDFGFARFDEPPTEPYVLSPISSLSNPQGLDLVSAFDGVSPFFPALYESVIRLAQQLEIQEELRQNLLLLDVSREFPSRELGKMEEILIAHKASIRGD